MNKPDESCHNTGGNALTHLSLFSGIGGIDLAAEWAGFKTVCFVENNEYCQKVLKKHWPDVMIIEDVKDVTKEKVMAYAESQQGRGLQLAGVKADAGAGGEPRYRITLISGGFPCQPHSVAGKRKGSFDERNLWPEFRRVIGEIKPRWVLGENVPGIFSSDSRRFFGEILSDLAALGYSVGWCTYGAVDVGALHRRKRVFIVGYAVGRGEPQPERIIRKVWRRTGDDGQDVADAAEKGLEGTEPKGKVCAGGMFAQCGDVSHAERSRWPETRAGANIYSGQQLEAGDRRGRDCRQPERRLDRMVDGFSYWLHEPDIPRVTKGQTNRVDRLKGLGNAVVPQQIYPILKVIADFERTANEVE